MNIQTASRRLGRAAAREARSLAWRALGRLRSTLTVNTKQGALTVSTSDHMIGRVLFVEREFEQHLMFEVVRLLNTLGQDVCKGTVLDIGANMGVTSIGMLKCGVANAAIAIEPDPTNFGLLRHNIKQNGMEGRVIAVNAALSDRAGSLQFELSEGNFGDHRVRIAQPKGVESKFDESRRRVIRVNADTLDHVLATIGSDLASQITFAWIDTQGHEAFVFRGGRKFLSRGIPVVAELWPYGLKRSGIGCQEFCALAREFWANFYVMRNGRFVRYPIGILDTMFEELGYDGEFDNVIFIK